MDGEREAQAHVFLFSVFPLDMIDVCVDIHHMLCVCLSVKSVLYIYIYIHILKKQNIFVFISTNNLFAQTTEELTQLTFLVKY